MAIRPIIFVGLGSTGGKIVSLLKKQMEQKASSKEKQFYRYVNIRSEVAPEDGTDEEIFSVTLASTGLATRTAVEQMWYPSEGNDEAVKSFKQWWYADVNSPEEPWVPGIDTLDTGVGGNPSIGRALLHYKLNGNSVGDMPELFSRFRDDFRTTREELPPAERSGVDVEQINCFLFGSLAGGTCSGIFFDISLIIKAQLGVGTKMFGVFLMGDVCSSGKSRDERDPVLVHLQHRNTQYAIAEMAFLASQTGWNIAKKEWPRVIGCIDLSQTPGLFDTNPFTSISLMGNENEDGFSFNLDGNKFDSYLLFLANYYTDFITSEALESMIARDVDRRATVIGTAPSRPCYFTRIGYMCLQIPTRKIEVLIRRKIAEELRLRFKSPNSKNCKETENNFFSSLQIHDWPKQCLDNRHIDVPYIPSDDPIQDSAEEFEEVWKNTKKKIDEAYSQFIDEDTETIRGIVEQFKGKWEPLLSDMLDNVLGQSANHSLALADVKVLLSAMVDDITGEYTTSLSTRTEQANLMTKIEGEFNDALSRSIDEFPSGILSWFKKKSWLANQDMGIILKKYHTAIHERAKATIAIAIRKPLLEELKKHICVREMISHYATGPAYRCYLAEETTLFAKTDDEKGIVKDIFSTREEILNSFVNPLLENNENARLNNAIDTVLNKWKGSKGSQTGIAGIWWLLVKQFDKNKPRNSDIEYKDSPKNKALLDQLQEVLRNSFDEAYHEVFDKDISELSVWKAITQYVKQERQRNIPAERALQGLFDAHLGHAKCFPRITPPRLADKFKYIASSPYYICNKDEAQECFKELGIADAATYLNRLIQHGLGISLSPNGKSADIKDKIQLLLCVLHELPYFYKGFDDVMDILSLPIKQSDEDRFVWCDSRFPNWIKEWWNTDDDKKPYYLRALKKMGDAK